MCFIRGINNKYHCLHFAIPCGIWAKLHLLQFIRLSPNTTRLRLVVFGRNLMNYNSCNFARYPTCDVKNSTWLRLVEFLTSLVGYLKNTPQTHFKSPKYPSAAPRGIWEIWNGSSGYFFQIPLELNFASGISSKLFNSSWMAMNEWVGALSSPYPVQSYLPSCWHMFYRTSMELKIEIATGFTSRKNNDQQ